MRRWTFTTDWWMSLIVAVLVTGCGGGIPDPGPGVQPDAGAGVTPTAGVAGETAVRVEAQDDWQAVRLDEMTADRPDTEAERRNPFRFGAARPSAPLSGPGGGDEPRPVVPGVDPSALAPGGVVSPGGTGGFH